VQGVCDGGLSSNSVSANARLCVVIPHPLTVVAREGGRSSIPETAAMESRSFGVLDTPHARGMTSTGYDDFCDQRNANESKTRPPHSSLALLNANDDSRRVFSSRISVRVTGGSARWLQFSRSQSRQLTPIGVPSAFSRSMPVA
jgi:hypothetical protein